MSRADPSAFFEARRQAVVGRFEPPAVHRPALARAHSSGAEGYRFEPYRAYQ
jgi:hypothetical protein